VFGTDRQQLRRLYMEAWQAQQAGKPLDPLQSLLAKIIAMHPEYHPLLEKGDDALDQDYSPEQGQSNPFLHMGMHIAIHEQLSTNRPKGLVEAYQRLLGQKGDAHEVEHAMMECLGQALWEAQRNNTAPDEQAYLVCVKRLLK
jgi:hypothetical protein